MRPLGETFRPFDLAQDRPPSSGEAYQWRGRAYLEAKEVEAALPDFNRAIELQPNSAYNYAWRGRTYLLL